MYISNMLKQTPVKTNAYREKIVKIQSHLFNFASKLTEDKSDAQDLTQDTLLKLLNNEENYTEDRNFVGWALIVMKNLFVNNHRKSSRYTTSKYCTENIENVMISSCIDIESAMQIKDINNLIAKNSDALKIPFSMYIAGYSYQEISEYLNIPIGTVKSRIFLIRKKLQKEIM